MGTKLYVGNLPFSIDAAGLRKLFEVDGRTVGDATIVSDRETGKPRGFGFVTMGSEADAAASIAKLDGLDLEGRKIRVNEATQKPAGRTGGFGGRPEGGDSRGGGGGGNYRGGGGGGDRRY